MVPVARDCKDVSFCYLGVDSILSFFHVFHETRNVTARARVGVALKLIFVAITRSPLDRRSSSGRLGNY
jgi:hypothetical protein